MSMWNLKTLAQCVLDAPQDRGINVGLARDLARAAVEADAALVWIREFAETNNKHGIAHAGFTHIERRARAALGEALAEVLHEGGAVLPGGMQYEKCVRVEGHTGPHITLRGDTWAASARSAASASGS